MTTNTYCDVYLIRHGETDWNKLGKMQGHTDIALNAEGERQALELKNKLASVQFSAVYSSDLMRASKTASLVVDSSNLNVVHTPMLREKAMGSWEGRLVHDYLEVLVERKISTAHLSKDEFVSKQLQDDIESYADVYKRLHSFLKSRVDAHLGSTILLSSHGGVLASVFYHIDYRQGQRWTVSNCGYVKLRMQQDGQYIVLETDGLALK